MKCTHCGAELPVGVKFCDICGQPVKRLTYEERAELDSAYRARTKKRAIIAVCTAALVICFALFMIWKNFIHMKSIQYDPNLYDMTVNVSAKEFNKLEIGMTYDRVCKIVGGEGAKYSEFGNLSYGTVTYIWPGEYLSGDTDASVEISFNNKSKRASWISEKNIADGKEVNESATGRRVAVIQKPISEISPLEEGMTYDEIVEILGCEGKLHYSICVVDSSYERNTTKYYTWEVPPDENGFVSSPIQIYFTDDVADSIYGL